jgi:hypothetical protein
MVIGTGRKGWALTMGVLPASDRRARMPVGAGPDGAGHAIWTCAFNLPHPDAGPVCIHARTGTPKEGVVPGFRCASADIAAARGAPAPAR